MLHVIMPFVMYKVGEMANTRDQYNHKENLTLVLYVKVANTQENITYRRAKKSVLSQLVTTWLHDKGKTL